jgi:hypothetical protein
MKNRNLTLIFVQSISEFKFPIAPVGVTKLR